MARFRREQLPDVSSRQWARLARLCVAGTKLELPLLRSATGMAEDDAFRFIVRVGEQHRADLNWLVFHGEHHATTRRFADGFQPTPWRCPACEEEVSDPSELRYELQAVLTEAVEVDQ